MRVIILSRNSLRNDPLSCFGLETVCAVAQRLRIFAIFGVAYCSQRESPDKTPLLWLISKHSQFVQIQHLE